MTLPRSDALRSNETMVDEEPQCLLFEFRRPTASWVVVNIRRLRERGFATAVLREGEPRKGTVVLKCRAGSEGWRLLSLARDADGDVHWFEGFPGRAVAEQEAEAYLARSALRDPDLWIVEIGQPAATADKR
jgi:hypothetical protein